MKRIHVAKEIKLMKSYLYQINTLNSFKTSYYIIEKYVLFITVVIWL